MIRAYFREANRESSSDFAPVTTIFPDAKINAVVLGSRIRMITAANRYAKGTASVTETSSLQSDHVYLGIVFSISGVHRNRL